MLEIKSCCCPKARASNAWRTTTIPPTIRPIPDATKEVRWGDQTFEEMMVGFFDVSFDAQSDPTALQRPARKVRITP